MDLAVMPRVHDLNAGRSLAKRIVFSIEEIWWNSSLATGNFQIYFP